MSTADGGVDRNVPIDLSSRVGLSKDGLQDPVPGPITGVAGMPLPHRLPRTKLLAGQIPPRNPRSIPVGDTLDYLAIVAKRMPLPPFIRGQQGFDPFQPLVGELAKPSLRLTHTATFSRVIAYLWETRPRRTH